MTSQDPKDRIIDRRDLLKGAAAAGLVSLLDPLPRVLGAATRRRDLIRAENEKPGTTDWQLSYAKLDPKAKYRSPRIEGYCSRTSPWPPSGWSG